MSNGRNSPTESLVKRIKDHPLALTNAIRSKEIIRIVLQACNTLTEEAFDRLQQERLENMFNVMRVLSEHERSDKVLQEFDERPYWEKTSGGYRRVMRSQEWEDEAPWSIS